MRKQVFDLYWMAYLLTGDRARSLAAVVETVEAFDDSNPVFENWFAAWSRKIFIARVLDRPASAPDLWNFVRACGNCRRVADPPESRLLIGPAKVSWRMLSSRSTRFRVEL